MPISHLITLNSSVSPYYAELPNDMPIGIVGTALSGDLNKLIRVSSAADLTQFGAEDATTTLVKNLKILQRYGCNNVYAVRVDKGADATATATNIVGTNTNGVKTGIQLFEDLESVFGVFPRWILAPTFSADPLVVQAILTAKKAKSMIALDFPVGTSKATATTTRATATGLGTKDKILHVCMPQVKVGSVIESLATHFVGVQGYNFEKSGFGFSSSNQSMLSVDGIEPGFTLSYTDPLADNQVLEGLGIVTVNLYEPGKYVIWGNRNALYQSDTNEGFNTYTNLSRVEQEINALLLDLSKKFIDQPCNRATAMLLETAYNNVLQSNAYKGNYRPESHAKFNETQSDFAKNTLAYDVVIYGLLPTETIKITTVVTV